MMPPMAIIGAVRIMVSRITSTFCTWLVSLVVRVISEAVLTVSNSCSENLPTWVKSRARTSRPKPTATRAAKNAAPIEAMAPAKVISSMTPPICRM